MNQGRPGFARRSVRRTAVLVSSLLAVWMAVFASAGTAQAAIIIWSAQNIGPTIYQTNYAYYGADLVAPAGTPSNKPITKLQYNYAFNAGTPAPAGTEAYLCTDPAGCIGPLGVSGTITHAFDGLPANSTFYYFYFVRKPTTYVLTPAVQGGVNKVQVTYNNP